MTDKLDTFEQGGAIEVPVARIEQELAALWRAAAQKAGKSGAVSRACLWNLIVRVDSEARFVEAKKLIDDVSAQLPARVIVLHTDSAAPDAPMRAWVEANWRQQGHVHSGSDEVTLFAAGRTVERLPSMVRSLVVTDAPTAMLWWGAPPSTGSRELLHEIDRLIVDTRKLPSEQGMADYHRIYDERPDLEMVDLAWLGVRPLRGLTAGIFDPPNDPRRLEALDRVRVTSGVTGCQSRALLTQGWLAAQLGWSQYRRIADAPNVRRWRANRRAGGEVLLEVETRVEGPNHGVSAVELESAGELWTLHREAGAITVKGPHCNARVQPMRQHTDSELVVSALGPRGRDPIFKSSLREAVGLIGAK